MLTAIALIGLAISCLFVFELVHDAVYTLLSAYDVLEQYGAIQQLTLTFIFLSPFVVMWIIAVAAGVSIIRNSRRD